jgi:hypothetical protein
LAPRLSSLRVRRAQKPRHTRERQFALWALSTFAVLALVLGAVGVYGGIHTKVVDPQNLALIHFAT